MRISDWSSDVCSSDLGAVVAGATNTANANNERILGSIQQNLIAKADIKDQIGWSTDRALRAVRRQFSSDIANHSGLTKEIGDIYKSTLSERGDRKSTRLNSSH